MRVCVLIPGNMIGGGVKMPVRLASHLAAWHDVTVTYPIVKHYVLYHKLSQTSLVRKLGYIAREYLQHRRDFVFGHDLDERVHLEKYLLRPAGSKLRSFDAVIYQSVWEYHTLKSLQLGGTHKIFWSLADYLFCNPAPPTMNQVLEAYLGDQTVVTPSERMRTDLECYGVKVDAVIHGGVDSIFSEEGRVWETSRPRILAYYQPAWWVKGGATLLQCLQWLRLRHPGLEISLFGHQDSDIGRNGSRICDHFYTGLSSAEVARLYRAHHIFIYPAYSDGFQSPPLEAMACGCAVVATRIGAVPEYGDDGKNILLCDPLNASQMLTCVETLLRKPELRISIGRQASIDAREWSWQDCALKFNKLLINTRRG